MPDRFSREKEQILTQFILHHELQEDEVGVLADRLDRVVKRAVELHAGQRRKTGEDYIWHPVRTAMEVSRFGRIVDWPSVEAALLHDTIEDTGYTFDEIQDEFPEAANLVLALTKIKDNKVLTYQKLFRFVLDDIRVLLIKLADRLNNLESLSVFKPEKQERIARESAEMYANICRRLCMLDVEGQLTDRIGPILHPAEFNAFCFAQEEIKQGWGRQLDQLRAKLAEVFPGDLAARIDIQWRRFRPGVPPSPENLFAVRIVTRSKDEAYRALGRVHLTFPALPGVLADTLSTPRKNGFRALETQVSYQGHIVSFYIASGSTDRFNRMGLLSMDISSPEFNLSYLEDLREFLAHDDMDIQDFLGFHRPDAIQVSSPTGEVFSLEEGATALDYAFAVHEQLGLRAQGALINEKEAGLDTVLRPGDRVEVVAKADPIADDRYLSWAHSRKALSRLRRYMRRQEARRATATGHQWFLEAAASRGLSPEEAEKRARRHLERTENKDMDDLYREVCLGEEDIAGILGDAPRSARRPGPGFIRLFRGRGGEQRKVRRYDFSETHIRFCSRCVPLVGDAIEGVPTEGRLVVHREGCAEAPGRGKIPLQWERGRKRDLRDPGAVELEIDIRDGSGVLYALLTPFKNQGVDIKQIRLPHGQNQVGIRIEPGSTRMLDRLIRSLRRHEFVNAIRVFRAVAPPDQVPNRVGGSSTNTSRPSPSTE